MYQSESLFLIGIKRSMKNSGTWVGLLTGACIALTQIFREQVPASLANHTLFYEKLRSLQPNTASVKCMIGSGTSVEAFLFFMLLPIIASMPYAITFFEDLHAGYLKSILVRVDRRKYLQTKFCGSIIAGAIITMLPLLMNYLFSLVLLPNLLPSSIFGNGISITTPGYQLYFSHPTVYLLLFILFDGLIGGFYAGIALLCCFLSDYLVVVIIIPFFLQLIWHILCSVTGMYDFSPIYFSMAGYGSTVHPLYAGLAIAAALVLFFLIFIKKGMKEDVQ